MPSLHGGSENTVGSQVGSRPQRSIGGRGGGRTLAVQQITQTTSQSMVQIYVDYIMVFCIPPFNYPCFLRLKLTFVLKI